MSQSAVLRLEPLNTGAVPGSLNLPRSQKSLQPRKDSTDIVAIIKGVIVAEEGTIVQYNKNIEV